jgi:hypothetical protein
MASAVCQRGTELSDEPVRDEGPLICYNYVSAAKLPLWSDQGKPAGTIQR